MHMQGVPCLNMGAQGICMHMHTVQETRAIDTIEFLQILVTFLYYFSNACHTSLGWYACGSFTSVDTIKGGTCHPRQSDMRQ